MVLQYGTEEVLHHAKIMFNINDKNNEKNKEKYKKYRQQAYKKRKDEKRG
jgi:hypothetical protein